MNNNTAGGLLLLFFILAIYLLKGISSHPEPIKGPCEENIFIQGEISAFYKITLKLPLSLNRETLEGLTAIPGIGPGIAKTIIRERAERKGFKSVEELMSIRGIGPSLYKRIEPHLVL